MTGDETSLGDRMKRYEASYRFILPRRTPAIIRVDGRAFHSVLKDAEKPYDAGFAHAMNRTAVALCQEIQGAVFAYTQSDEISVLVSDYRSLNFEPWFGGVVSKWLSISAGVATAAFNLTQTFGHGTAHFDSRVFTISDAVEVANYFVWRQRDATRNSILMAGQHHFSHARLQGKNTDEIQEMLWQEHNVNWNDYPERFKRGGLVLPPDLPPSMGETWRPVNAPVFQAMPGTFLPQWIPELPSLHD